MKWSADLSGTKLSETDLSEFNLRNTTLDETILKDVTMITRISDRPDLTIMIFWGKELCRFV